MGVPASAAPVCESSPCPTEGYGATAAGWRLPVLQAGGMVLVCLFLFRYTAASIVHTWWVDSTYSYGFVIIPIAIFLGWRRRAELACIRPSVSVTGLLLLGMASAFWMAGNLAGVLELEQFALVVLLQATVWVLLGTEAARILSFALSFLLFAVPTGGGLVQPLQRLTAEFTVRALRLTGIPALLDGFILSIPSGEWEVTQACSGLRYLTASVVVGILFAGIAYRTWRRRVAFVAISALVPLLANALRAYGIIVLGHITNNRLAAGVDHVIYGWLFFSFITALLLFMGTRWHESVKSGRSAVPVSSQAPTTRNSSRVILTLVAMAFVLPVSIGSDYLWSHPIPSTTSMPQMIPGGEWVRATAGKDDDWAPELASLKTTAMETLVSQSETVSFVAGRYPEDGRIELVQAYNAVTPWSGWHVGQPQTVTARIAGREAAVRQYELQRGSEARLVRVWYAVGGQLTASPYLLKLLSAKCRILRQPQGAALFAVSVPYSLSRADSMRALDKFVEEASFPDMMGHTR